MDDMKKMMKQCLQMACNAVTDAHLEAIGEDRMMTVAEWEEIMVDSLIANGVTIPVRCKDCEKWQRHTHVDRERGHCRRFDMTKHESGFCDRGERRTDG